MTLIDSSTLVHPSGAHVETALPDGTLVVTGEGGTVQSATLDGQSVTLTKALRQTLVDAGYRDTAEQTTAPEVTTVPEQTTAFPDADASSKGALLSPAPAPSSQETKPKRII